MIESGDVTLGVERGRAAGAGSRHRLPVVVVDHVTTGEDTVQVGARGGVVDEHIAVLVEVDLTAEQLGPRVVADRDEQAGDRQLALLTRDRVGQA